MFFLVTTPLKAAVITVITGFSGWLLGWLVRYVLGTARLLSKLPCAALYPENSYILAWCVFFYVALLLHIFLPQRPRLRVSVSCFAVTLCLSLLMAYAQLHILRSRRWMSDRDNACFISAGRGRR
jgi:hypothetical protein